MLKKQRTRLEALQHIKVMYDAKRLGATLPDTFSTCVYETVPQRGKTRYCAVGCLFNAAQHADIKSRKVNNKIITELVCEFGQDNIEYVTGLELAELANLQLMHDTDHENIKRGYVGTKLYRWLQNEISCIECHA